MLEELTLPLPRSATTAAAEVDLPALVETYAATLFRVAHAVLRNRAEAEDTVQDTFVRVLEHRGSLPTIRDLRPWLIRITWNLAVDRRRRVRRNPTAQADDLFLQTLGSPHPGTDRAFEDAEQTRRVLGAIERLPKAERQALLLSALEELSTVEIAEVMGKSESAIRALIYRARTHLRERLDKGGKR